MINEERLPNGSLESEVWFLLLNIETALSAGERCDVSLGTSSEGLDN